MRHCDYSELWDGSYHIVSNLELSRLSVRLVKQNSAIAWGLFSNKGDVANAQTKIIENRLRSISGDRSSR